MNNLLDVRPPGLGLAPARHVSAVNEAERLAYFSATFDRVEEDPCLEDGAIHRGTRRPAPTRKPALGASAR